MDLTYASEGEISLRARALAGLSNNVKLDVNEFQAIADDKPAHAYGSAVKVPFPADISGRIDTAGDENFYRFHVSRKQVLTLKAMTRAMGSPMDAFLTLRNSAGAAMQSTDDGGTGEPAITRELDAGDYILSLRDLYYHGGPTYSYRVQIHPGINVVAGEEGFAVRFLPDAVRISRGANSIIMVDVQRKADFKGDVTVTLEDLPPGVLCPPLVVSDKLPARAAFWFCRPTPTP